MNCLLEIGIENFPAQYLNETLRSLEQNFSNFLKEYKILFSNLELLATSRRIVVKFKILNNYQEDSIIEIIGPNVNIALDEKGNFNNIAKSFAESKGYSIEKLDIKETLKGKYIFIHSNIKGKKVEKILPEVFQKAIFSLKFDKTMNWNSFPFIRPINWILSFLDNNLINFNLGNVKADKFTYPNKSISLEKVTINSYNDYFDKIEKLGVILSFKERRDKITSYLIKMSEKANDDIIDRNANICEFPNPALCNFEKKFLNLPDEVIVRTLEEHQNAIPIFKNNAILNSFVVVRDGLNFNENIKRGNERVVKARLTDAEFFQNEDLKHPLEYYNQFLDTILFQKNLGSMNQKVERIVNLSKTIYEKLNLDKEPFIKAAQLCKADLATSIVKEKEYKILKGYIGMNYAKSYGEKVSKLIFEHYLPRFKGDIMPSTLEGALLSIIDKIDNIVGISLINLLPSGAKDPFYIRREAIALIEVILKFELDFSFNELLKNSFEEYKKQNLANVNFDSILENLELFMKNRIESHYQEIYPKNLVNSVISHWNNLKDFNERLKILDNYYKNKEFENIVEISKRVKNIVKGFDFTSVKEQLLVEKEEKELYNETAQLEKIAKERNYNEILNKILNMKDLLNRFFEKVIVNTENKEIKNNRLSLLKKLDNLINLTADISLC